MLIALFKMDFNSFLFFSLLASSSFLLLLHRSDARFLHSNWLLDVCILFLHHLFVNAIWSFLYLLLSFSTSHCTYIGVALIS